MDPPLLEAIKGRNVQGVKQALASGANPNEEYEGYTPLTYISEDLGGPNGVEIIRVLLKAGADANVKSSGETPLYFAADALRNFYNDREEYNNPVEYEKSYLEAIDLLCPATSPENIQEVNKKYPGILPESCLSSSTTARVEPAMKALERQTNKSYGAPPGTYDVPPGFSESVGEYAFGIKTPRPTAGKRKHKKKTNKRRKTLKRRRTLKK
jgi:hypothetical protein